MDHGLAQQRLLLPELVKVSERVGVPLLATNDSHYTKPDESETHDVLLCINTGSNFADEKRLRFGSQEFYIKSARDMRERFPADLYPGACDNTLLVAERVDMRMETGDFCCPTSRRRPATPTPPIWRNWCGSGPGSATGARFPPRFPSGSAMSWESSGRWALRLTS